jgi:hypothetical protein
LPVFGKQRERQVILGTEIFIIGVSYAALQMTMSPPEAVPKMPQKSLMLAKALIFVEWQL